jgi:hypothetical protein
VEAAAGIAENAANIVHKPGDDPASLQEDPHVLWLTGPNYPPAPTGAPGPELELARAYIPYQKYTSTYSPREALEKGTLFPELYRPYLY